jgi:Bacterial antitoxin of type II TA system, VapB
VKTTIEIDDELLRQAKIRAAQGGETLRALVERGLRRELAALELNEGGGYVLRDASVGGGEINSEFLPWHWDKVRDLIYEDRDA